MNDREPEAIHAWFGLSYANYLCLPRSVLQSMPDEWQQRFVRLLEELQEEFGHLDWPNYRVCPIVLHTGRFKPDPIPHYNRGRTRLEPKKRAA